MSVVGSASRNGDWRFALLRASVSMSVIPAARAVLVRPTRLSTICTRRGRRTRIQVYEGSLSRTRTLSIFEPSAQASRSSVQTYCVTLCATFTHTHISSPSFSLMLEHILLSTGGVEPHLVAPWQPPASRSTVSFTTLTMERCRRTLFVARFDAPVVVLVLVTVVI